MAEPTEPTTEAAGLLLNDLVNDHEAPSYHVIERVRQGAAAIEAEARQQGAEEEARGLALTVGLIPPTFSANQVKAALGRAQQLIAQQERDAIREDVLSDDAIEKVMHAALCLGAKHRSRFTGECRSAARIARHLRALLGARDREAQR